MFTAYEIGIKLRLTNLVSGALGVIARDFAKTDHQAKALQTRLDALQKGLWKGAAYGAVGVGGLMLFKRPLEEAGKLQIAIARLQAIGLGASVNSDAIRFARGMDIYGMALTDKIGVMKDALSVFGDLKRAELAAPLIAKMIVANRVLYGQERGDQISQGALPLMKVAELRGGITDPRRLSSQINWAEKSYISSGGMVNPQQFLNAMRTGGIPLKQMSDQAFYVKSEPIMQELGGFRFGTGMNALYNNWVQGRSPVRAVTELMRLGLVDKKNVEYTAIGTVKRIRPGALKDSGLFVQDYVEWIKRDLIPALRAHGFTTLQSQLTEAGATASNSRGANLLGTVIQQMPAIDRAMQRVTRSADVNKAYDGSKNTLSGAGMNFLAQWHTLLGDIGTTDLPPVVLGLNGMADALKKIDVFVKGHPRVTEGASFMVGGLSVAALAVSTMTIGKALLTFAGILKPKGPLGAALEGVEAAAPRAGFALTRLIGPLALMLGMYEMSKGVSGSGTLGKNWSPNWMKNPWIDWQKPLFDQGGASPFVPKFGGKSVAPSNVYMDGRKVGVIVTGHQTKSMAGPLIGGSSFDPSMSLAPVALGAH